VEGGQALRASPQPLLRGEAAALAGLRGSQKCLRRPQEVKCVVAEGMCWEVAANHDNGSFYRFHHSSPLTLSKPEQDSRRTADTLSNTQVGCVLLDPLQDAMEVTRKQSPC
jgi:hypothetical protein